MKSQFNFTLTLISNMHIISCQAQVSVGIANQGLLLPFCSPLEKQTLCQRRKFSQVFLLQSFTLNFLISLIAFNHLQDLKPYIVYFSDKLVCPSLSLQLILVAHIFIVYYSLNTKKTFDK